MISNGSINVSSSKLEMVTGDQWIWAQTSFLSKRKARNTTTAENPSPTETLYTIIQNVEGGELKKRWKVERSRQGGLIKRRKRSHEGKSVFLYHWPWFLMAYLLTEAIVPYLCDLPWLMACRRTKKNAVFSLVLQGPDMPFCSLPFLLMDQSNHTYYS